MNSAAAVELDGLTRRAGKFTLGPIFLNIPRGAVLALIGPNGAGKTTTLELILGITRPDAGSIKVLGMRHPQDEVAIKSKVAYVNPDLDFRPWVTAGRAIDFVRGFYPDWDTERCTRLMSEFSLQRDDVLNDASSGARIKLGLVMAMSRDPELLLLDEPTTWLDPRSKEIFFAVVREIMKRENRTVIISSHQLSDLERHADHIVMMNKGTIRLDGSMADVLSRFVLVDALLTPGLTIPIDQGILLVEESSGRARLLLDLSEVRREALPSRRIEIIAETAPTLEELFLILTKE